MKKPKASTSPDGQEPASIAELAKALVATPEAQAMLRQSGAKRFEDLIGKSGEMRQVVRLGQRAAQSTIPILVEGESGVGKELIARAIQGSSDRSGKSFVTVNCGAIPENLVESILFGHEKGAFTGANDKHLGKFQEADGGTLFLDEIGDLPLDLQGHLLRFLQEGQIFRLGGRHPVSVQTRVIAATHVDLRRAIAAGKFREDLFYRLNVLVITMPPLRERADDIDLMATVFLRQVAADMGRDIEGYTDDARAALRAHAWPGNVRELIATVRRAVVMANERWIDTEDLGLPADIALPPPSPHRGRAGIDRQKVIECLMRNGQNRSRAARELGISRVTLYRVLRRNDHSDGQENDG